MATPPAVTKSKSWFTYFQYQEGRDSPAEARNILLIVATLIAAVTFQAGVNPPGGVWQDDENGHVPGRAIYATEPHSYYVFLISNTIALSTSILVIISLTYRFPFHFEILAATVSMLVTYGSAIFAVTPKESVKFRYVLSAAALPFVLRGLIQGFYICRNLILKYYCSNDHHKVFRGLVEKHFGPNPNDDHRVHKSRSVELSSIP